MPSAIAATLGPLTNAAAPPAISRIEPLSVARTARCAPIASSSGPLDSPTLPARRFSTQSAARIARSYSASPGLSMTDAPIRRALSAMSASGTGPASSRRTRPPAMSDSAASRIGVTSLASLRTPGKTNSGGPDAFRPSLHLAASRPTPPAGSLAGNAMTSIAARSTRAEPASSSAANSECTTTFAARRTHSG